MSIIPALPEAVPTFGNRISRQSSALLLRMLGWRWEGEFPNLPRCVVIVGPHTSNWDFVVAILMMGALGIRVTWIGKHTIFRWPFGRLFRYLGGIPVDRSAPQGLVEQVTVQYSSNDRMIVAIAPEGTRSRTERWRTGFYHIAAGAQVPVVPVYLDFRRKRAGAGRAVMPTDDQDGDIQRLKDFYAPYGASARRSEYYGIR